MSVSYGSRIILGLPYEEMEAYLGKDLLNHEIDYDNLQIGSVHFDSEHQLNVVGVALVSTSSYKEFTLEQLHMLSAVAVPAIIAGLPLKFYLTNDIT